MSEAKPKIKNTIKHIFDNQEYYGENVLHMGCVAEDASLVKWLLDIGSDIHRWILGYSQVEIRISKYVSKYCTHLIYLKITLKGDVTGTSFAATTRNVFEETQKPTNMLTFH